MAERRLRPTAGAEPRAEKAQRLADEESDAEGLSTDWYDSLEPGVRPFVRLLRDNGINTTCSCEHTMTIEAEWRYDDEPRCVWELLCTGNYLFDITACVRKSLCSTSRSLTITIRGENPCPHACASPEKAKAMRDLLRPRGRGKIT